MCSGCGADLRLAARPAVVEVNTPTPVVMERPAPVIVERGMSDSAKLLTALATIVGVVLIGFVFYQWGRAETAEEQEARAAARNSNSRSTSDRLPPTRTEPAQAPVVIVPGASPTPAPVAPTADSSQTAAPTVDRELVRYTATIDPMLKRWKDELRRAERAQGADLTASIVKLEEIEREISRITPAPMATGVHTRLLEIMTATMDSLDTASQTQTAVTNVPAYVQARELFDRFEADYSALRSSRG